MVVDNNEEKAMYYLTDSQQFNLMKDVSESLAGRIGILNLLGLSLREIKGINFNEEFTPTNEYIEKREIDLIIEQNGKLYQIEIKKVLSYPRRWVKILKERRQQLNQVENYKR